MAWMTGAHSELREVPAAEGEDYYGNGAHGRKTVMRAFDLPSAAERADTSIPTSQMFSEGNGGESRKSYHGYPPGYAQLIDSPTSWHITPMQIDTRNRECGVGPENIHNCTPANYGFIPGPEPRQSRYGRGIPASGTNYSGILECPCNGGYGGSSQFYRNHPEAGNATKHIDHKYSAINAGECDAKSHIGTAAECFDSMAFLGISSTKVVNKTVSDATVPFGCSVSTDKDGTVDVTFNSAGDTQCAPSTTKVAAVDTELGVTMAMSLTSDGKPTMVRSAKGEYCGSNQVGVLAKFPTTTLTNVTAMNAALTQCEAFCEGSKDCTACSVDEVDQKFVQWVAIKTCGKIQEWNGAIPGDISVKTSGGTATITLKGPSNAWFGIGFNAVVMSDSPYTIVVNSTSVWEQKIGTCGSEAEHCPGDRLQTSIKVLSSTVTGDVRTVVLSRPFAGATKNHYTFSFDTPTIDIISAVGKDQVFAYHASHNTLAVTLVNPAGPTCICDLGSVGELCENGGVGCGKFTKNCVPAPAGSLLEQDNPTCNSRQYVGGLSCCHHDRIMLDMDQSPGEGELLRYHMKFRYDSF